MSKWIAIVAAGICVAGCGGDQPPKDPSSQSASSAGASQGGQGMSQSGQGMSQSGSTQTPMAAGDSAAAPDQIRMFMLQERPNDADIIRGLVIDEKGGVVTLRGRVYDERMKSDATRAAQKARGVQDVRNDLQIDPSMRSGSSTGGTTGAGTTTGSGGSEASVSAIRATMLRERPEQADIIKSLTITESGDVITVTGLVPDEKIQKQLMEAAKNASAGKSVRDNTQVKKK